MIGLLHPGDMGAAIGRCLTGLGHPVCWASAGRGQATAARAARAGLSDAGTVAALAARSGVILSICPPHAAVDVARSVAAAGFRGLFTDANAISPATSRLVAGIIEAAGGSYVDGGIIGLPPTAPEVTAVSKSGEPARRPAALPLSPGSTRLYLSGPRAGEIRELLSGSWVDARIVDGPAGAASAVKMAYAAWTKGSAALLLAAQALAEAEGVRDTLLAEWELSQPALAGRSQGAARSAAMKGWRWVAEMEEIAGSMTAAGLPSGFHQAAAEIFRRQPRIMDGEAVTISDVISALLAGVATNPPGPPHPS